MCYDALLSEFHYDVFLLLRWPCSGNYTVITMSLGLFLYSCIHNVQNLHIFACNNNNVTLAHSQHNAHAHYCAAYPYGEKKKNCIQQFLLKINMPGCARRLIKVAILEAIL